MNNKKYNSLTFIEMVEPKMRPNGAKRKMALFVCDCGDKKIYDYSKVTNLETKQCYSCGRKIASKKKIKHNMVNHSLYRKWSDIKKRCYNPKVDRYKNYGALGIKVCDEWKNDFLNFYNWSIKNGWREGLTIERKDNYKDYSPDNCTYIPLDQQKYNKKNTFFVKINAVQVSLSKLLNEQGLGDKYCSIWHGLKKGKTIEYYIEKYNIKT